VIGHGIRTIYIASILSRFFVVLSHFFNSVVGDLKHLLYITCMNYLKFIICVLLVLSLVGCAVSRNPNPVIRYGANTGATLAGPGFAALCIAGALDEDGSDKDVEKLGLIGLGAAAGGFLVGAVLGGTVGFFKWMFNGFENDDIASSPALPEEILPPTKPDNEYGSKL
jgi:hypothetical protein